MIPRFGDPPEKGRRYILRPGAYAILPRGRSVLLTIQKDDSWDLQLPGGGIDPGENPLRAVHREVLEETGWRIGTPRHFRVFRRFRYMPEYDKWAEKVCHIYVARPICRLHEPTEPEHIATWIPMTEAQGLLDNPGDRDALQRYVASLG